MPGVKIKSDKTERPAHCSADICQRPARPPFADLPFVRSSISKPVAGAGVLALIRTFGAAPMCAAAALLTRAASSTNPVENVMQWENRDAGSGSFERRVKHSCIRRIF